MGVKNFQITLQCSNPNLVFFAGSPVVGTVCFTIDEKPKTARGMFCRIVKYQSSSQNMSSHKGVCLKFVGEAKVKWSERKGTGDNRRTVWYRNEERCFCFGRNKIGTVLVAINLSLRYCELQYCGKSFSIFFSHHNKIEIQPKLTV